MERGCKMGGCPGGHLEGVLGAQACEGPGRARSGQGDGKPEDLRS